MNVGSDPSIIYMIMSMSSMHQCFLSSMFKKKKEIKIDLGCYQIRVDYCVG